MSNVAEAYCLDCAWCKLGGGDETAVDVARAALEHRAEHREMGSDDPRWDGQEHTVILPCLGNPADGYHRWMRENIGRPNPVAHCHFCDLGHPRPHALRQDRGLGLGVAG